MKKIHIMALLLLATVSAFADVVKIGVILPLSGNNAMLGEKVLPALKLFEAENAKGGTKHTYKIILEDDQITPRLTAQAANKLFNIDKVDAVLSFSSGSGNVIAPIAKQKRIPHICIGSDTTIASKNAFSYLHWVKPASEAQGIVEIAKRMGAKRAAIISMRHQGVQAIIKELEPRLKADGIIVAASEDFNPGERDFRTHLTRIREQNPEILIPVAFSPELEIILRQQREVGLNLPMPSAEVYDFTSAIDLSEGQFYVSGSTGTDSFKKHLRETLGLESDYSIPFVYNILDLFRAAYEKQEKIDPVAAADFLNNLKDYPSAAGLISTDKDRFIDTPPAYFKIENGKIRSVSLEEITPLK